MSTLSRTFFAIKDSEKSVAILMVVALSLFMLFVSGNIYSKNYNYYKNGVAVNAEILSVEEFKKWDSEYGRWQTYLDAIAKYNAGSLVCHVKVDRMFANQEGYDLLRKGAHQTMYYLDESPCTGVINRYRYSSIAHALTIFSMLALFLISFPIRRAMR